MTDNHEVERLALQMIADHGPDAPIAATARLNECIDEGDKRGRDYWAQVVYYIHWLKNGRPLVG